MDQIKIVIIEDNARIRFLIREILDGENDIEICDEAENLEKARQIIEDVRPDIVLLDISFGGKDGGLKLLNEISQLSKSTHAIILSAYSEDIYATLSLKAGAKGYICKDKTVGCLAEAIRCVYSGKEFVSSRI